MQCMQAMQLFLLLHRHKERYSLYLHPQKTLGKAHYSYNSYFWITTRGPLEETHPLFMQKHFPAEKYIKKRPFLLKEMTNFDAFLAKVR